MTAASGGNRESLLGLRPAGCEARTKGRSRCWEPQPGQWHGVSRDGEVISTSELFSYRLLSGVRYSEMSMGSPSAHRCSKS